VEDRDPFDMAGGSACIERVEARGLGTVSPVGNAGRPRRGLRRTAAVLVALALTGSTGAAVTLTVPHLSAAQPAPARAAVVHPVPVLGPLAGTAPVPTAPGVSGALDPLAGRGLGDFTGIVTDPATGTALWDRDSGTALVPGSTGKLLTVAAALLTLNPTDRLVTRVVAGAQPGTVVLVGGGDPTLTALPAGTQGVYPDPARLTALADAVKKASPVPVTRVLVDTSRYTGRGLQPSWDPADVAGGFVTPIEPLMLDGGRIDPTLQDGPRVSDPALAAGRAFARLLGVDPDRVADVTATPGAKVLGTVTSATVADLVEHTLRTSDNVLAEVLAREVAVDRKGDPSFAGAAAETLAALSQAGFDVTGARMVDGSGLSTDDRVPARLLGALLAAAAAPARGPEDVQFLRPIVTGLPVAGGDGTLDDRFGADTPAAAGRGVVRAKTGTLTGVSSLAGVTTDADGRLLVFALMSNDVTPALVRPRLDALAARLSRCGCR
jgi:D-alanyl-D-alanine carboxypeptidase/D-alanyl-D-alanine-endopeptidase (penicillin-binding protein 4)